tara:strand:+ start:21461 stop:21625 length:165 start_codon:yes stop_codon:yes gene_type:complete
MTNKESLETRLANHKICYDLAVNVGDDKEIKRHAVEMQNIKIMLSSSIITGVVK